MRLVVIDDGGHVFVLQLLLLVDPFVLCGVKQAAFLLLHESHHKALPGPHLDFAGSERRAGEFGKHGGLGGIFSAVAVLATSRQEEAKQGEQDFLDHVFSVWLRKFIVYS